MSHLVDVVLGFFALLFQLTLAGNGFVKVTTQLDQLVKRLVSLGGQLISDLHELVHILLLAHGQAVSLLDQLGQIDNLMLQALNGLLGRLLLLQRVVRDLPGFFEFLEKANRFNFRQWSFHID